MAAALARNPRLAAARHAWTAETARARAEDGFYQPLARVAAGGGRGPAGAPESTLTPRMPGEAVGAQAGLLFPLRAGALVGIGASHRYLFEADGFEDLGQSTAGLRLEVPLLRDRGFRTQKMSQAAADAVAAGAAANVAVVRQEVLRETLLAYAGWLHAAADLRESEQAMRRVEQLRDETAARVQLQATAEYQLFPAEMEVAFRQEELRQAGAVLLNAGHRLRELTVAELPAGGANPALLREWAALCAAADAALIAGGAAAGRPELRRAAMICLAADHQAETAREATRADLSLVGGVGYQAEDEDGGLGRDNLLADRRGGAEVALVWGRPLSFQAERDRFLAALAEAETARAEERRVRLQIEMERALAATALEAARDRLGMVDRAVLEARRTLAAEEERLRLGEGRSRHVLDAQKDLTTAERRASQAAYETVGAFIDLLYAAGVPLAPGEGEEEEEDSHVAREPSD